VLRKKTMRKGSAGGEGRPSRVLAGERAPLKNRPHLEKSGADKEHSGEGKGTACHLRKGATHNENSKTGLKMTHPGKKTMEGKPWKRKKSLRGH